MKYKLIIDKSLLKAQYQQTLSRSLLVCPDTVIDIKDLLKFAYKTFSFAINDQIVDSSDLYLCTEDDFLLPPNAKADLALDQNQIIKLNSIKVKLSGSPHQSRESPLQQAEAPLLFNVPSAPLQAEIKQPILKPIIIEDPAKVKDVVADSKQKKNRRKEGNLLGKRKSPVLEIPSSSSESSSSESSSESSSSSEDEKVVIHKRKVNQKLPKRESKEDQKKQQPDMRSMVDKIRGEFSTAFKKSEHNSHKLVVPEKPQDKVAPPKHQNKPTKSLEELKSESFTLNRPYLNQFDHLLPQKTPQQAPKKVSFDPVLKVKEI